MNGEEWVVLGTWMLNVVFLTLVRAVDWMMRENGL